MYVIYINIELELPYVTLSLYSSQDPSTIDNLTQR